MVYPFNQIKSHSDIKYMLEIGTVAQWLERCRGSQFEAHSLLDMCYW